MSGTTTERNTGGERSSATADEGRPDASDANGLSPARLAQKDFEALLARRLGEVRRDRGLSRGELARLAGLPPSALGRLERMRDASLYLETICRVLTPLGLRLDIVPDRETLGD